MRGYYLKKKTKLIILEGKVKYLREKKNQIVTSLQNSLWWIIFCAYFSLSGQLYEEGCGNTAQRSLSSKICKTGSFHYWSWRVQQRDSPLQIRELCLKGSLTGAELGAPEHGQAAVFEGQWFSPAPWALLFHHVATLRILPRNCFPDLVPCIKSRFSE